MFQNAAKEMKQSQGIIEFRMEVSQGNTLQDTHVNHTFIKCSCNRIKSKKKQLSIKCLL